MQISNAANRWYQSGDSQPLHTSSERTLEERDTTDSNRRRILQVLWCKT